MEQQLASNTRRRRKRRWLQLLASASGNLTTTIYTTAHNYQHEQQNQQQNQQYYIANERKQRATIRMVAMSTLCTSVIVFISLSTIMSYNGGGGGCHAAPGTLELVSKLAHRSSSSPPVHSSSASHLVKTARLATYSLSCPPEASIHPCTCIYHTPGAGIESEEEEEIYELSPAITTPYAEPLVQTTTPGASLSTTGAILLSSTTTTTTTTKRPEVASSPTDPVDATNRPTSSSSSLPSAPTTTSSSSSSTNTTVATTAAPTQSSSTQPNEHMDAQIGNAHDQQQAVPSFVVVGTATTTTITTTTTMSTHEPQATGTTLPEQQASTITTRAPALKSTPPPPVDGTTTTSTTGAVTGHSAGCGAQEIHSKTSESTTVRPQQSEAITTSAPSTSGRKLEEEPVTPVAIQTNSSRSLNAASVESAGGRESRNGAIASSSLTSVNLNNPSSVGQASTAGAVGQQEAVAIERRPAQNPATSDQKIPEQQSLDSLTPPQPSPSPSPPPSSPPPLQPEPYQPPLVQPRPGSIAESPARVTAGERTSEQSPSNNMTNVSQSDKQTNLELEPDSTATSGRVMSPAASVPTAQALGQAQPLVAETTEIPLRLTPSSTATIRTETQESRQTSPKLTSVGGPFAFVSETGRPTTTPMPLQTTSAASVAPSTAESLAAGISVASLNLTVPGPSGVGTSDLAAPVKVDAANESAAAKSATTTASAPTAHGHIGMSGARLDKQEVVTSPRAGAFGEPANVASAQAENNGPGTPATPISSSAVLALNETKHDYNFVGVPTVAGVEATNSTRQHPLKTPTGVLSNSTDSQGGGGGTIHGVPPHSAAAASVKPNQSIDGDGGGKQQLDPGSARVDAASALRPVTLDTSPETSTTTVPPPSSPVSVTNQSASISAPLVQASSTRTGAPTIVGGQREPGQQSNASGRAAASATIVTLLSSQVQSVKPQRPVPNSSNTNADCNSSASHSLGQSPGANNTQASAIDQTNPAPPSLSPSFTNTIHRLANNHTTHRASPPPGNSSALKAPGERPVSAGRAMHNKPLIAGASGNNNNTTGHHHDQPAHQNQPKPAQNNNNHQSLTATQNGRQILTPNTHRPKPHASRPTVAGNQHHKINSSGQQSNRAVDGAGARESPPAAGSGSSPGPPPLRRSTRSAGTGAARPLNAHKNHTGGDRPPPPRLKPALHNYQRLTPNTLAAQVSRRPNVMVTSTPNANPQFTNSSQRAPGGRRLTRFLSHDHHSGGNLLSAQDPFADANEQKVEVVAYCRNIQNMQVLRSAIKGFRGHQVNYFVIDSCKVPPFPNDLFHGIDVRWLEMSNSTVQFHNNFLHGAHHNQQGQLA